MDYSKTTLSKYLSEEEVLKIKEDHKMTKAVVKEKDMEMTAEKVTKAMEYIPYIGVSVYPNDKADISYMSLKEIATECELSEEQLQQLVKEYKSVSRLDEELS